MDPLLQQIMQGGSLDEQLGMLAPNLRFAQSLMQPQSAPGATVGRTYVAASPFEHLANALRPIIGQRMLQDVQGKEQALLDKRGQARSAFANALSDAQQPVQAPQGMTPAQQLDTSVLAPPDTQLAPRMDQQQAEEGRGARLLQLRNAGMLSTDPEIQNFAQRSGAMELQQEGIKKTRLEQQLEALKLKNEGPQAELGGVTPSVFELLTKRAGVPKVLVNQVTGAVVDAHTGKTISGGPAQTPASPDTLEPLPPPGSKAGNAYQKMIDSFKKDMDAAAASSRSAFGQSANVVFRGARNLALLNQKNPDGSQKQLTLPEWQEVTAGLIAMQTGGVPTEGMLREGLPKDVQGDAAGIMSWLTSDPHAPDRQKWIERFTANVNREDEAAKKYQRSVQMQRLPSYSQFFGMYPNRAKLAGAGYGIAPELIDQIRSGTFRMPVEGGGDAQGGGAKRKRWDPVAGKIVEE